MTGELFRSAFYYKLKTLSKNKLVFIEELECYYQMMRMEYPVM